MKILLFILKNLGGYKRLFYFVAAAGIINGVASFFIPVSLAEFANNPFAPGNLGSTVSIIVGFYVVSLVTSYVVRGQGEALAKNFSNALKLKYFRELSALPLGRLRKKHSVYMQSLVNKATDGISSIIFALIWNLFPGILLLILFFGYMARESFFVAFINLMIMGTFVIVSVMLARKMVPIAAEQNRRNATLLGSYADFMANISTVVQLGVRPYSRVILEKQAARSNEQTDILQQFHARRWFLLHSLFGLAYISTIGYLVWQVTTGNASVGLLILFVSAYGMTRSLIENLSETVRSFMEVKAYLGELEEAIGIIPNESVDTIRSWKEISMSNVAFKYPGDNVVIRIPSFSIKQKQKICIEGKSGQGKSTFLGLLSHSYLAQEGDLQVDGLPFEKAGRGFFENNVAVIAQEAELFHMSVRENLALGKQVSDKKLKSYLKELDMLEWLNSLDKGLDSIIGEKGVTLSAGQRQRLNILRAIILDRSLYILDEPTSHLDKQTEEVVVAFLRKYLIDKAAIIVTHRSALRTICDAAYKMANHQLVSSR